MTTATVTKNKSAFVGLTPYQIGLAPRGYAFLFLDAERLPMTPQEATDRLEEMGFKPSVRYEETESGLKVRFLLKAVKLADNFDWQDESPFDDIIEDLYDVFGEAVRSRLTPANQTSISNHGKLGH